MVSRATTVVPMPRFSGSCWALWKIRAEALWTAYSSSVHSSIWPVPSKSAYCVSRSRSANTTSRIVCTAMALATSPDA
jgi:hypothetical protein